MSRYFVNLAQIGWVELHNNDLIDRLMPGIWFSRANESGQFVSVQYNNQMYKVHISQLQAK